MAVRFLAATANAMTNARTALFTSGTIKIYSGAQPADPSVAPTGTLLATLTMDATPVGAASGGTASLNDLPLSVNAVATGTAGYYRIATSGGTAIEDGSCGTSGTDMILSTTSLVSGVAVTITAATFSQPLT